MQQSIKLTDVDIDEYAQVEKIEYTGLDRRRFLDLGIVKGTKLKPVLKSPSGGTRAYEIRKSIIALREEDANNIEVTKWDT